MPDDAPPPLDPNNPDHYIPKPPSQSEVDQLIVDLAAAEDLWVKAEARTGSFVVCDECGGRGSLTGGSLGDTCYICNGTGQVIDEFAEGEPLALHPGFGKVRGELASAAAEGRQVDVKMCREAITEIRTGAKAAVKEHRAKQLGAGGDGTKQIKGGGGGGSLGSGGGSLGGGGDY